MGKQQKAAKSNSVSENQSNKTQKNNQGSKNKNISKPNNQSQPKKQNQNIIAQKNNGSQNKSNHANQKQNNKPITDQRFTKASYDPRFLRPKKEMTKVKIDNRFSKMLTDPAFQNLSKVDKYGRKIADLQNKKQNQELKEYYTKEDEQIDQQEDDSQQENDDQIDEQQNSSEMDQQDQDDQQIQESAEEEEGNLRKWMEEYDQESSSLGDMPVQEMLEDEEKQIPEVWSDSEENVIKNQTVKATKRLALCNYDWMNISSKDLMILFNSFKPPTGLIKSIKVYQSIFGKQKMEQQEVFGPQGIWNDEQQIDEFQEQQNKKLKKSRKSWKQLLKKQDSSALDSAKLRAYEKQRLKYFYAVIECDNKKTADQIYKQCDGNQFQSSNLQFDLRFIPDDTSFDTTMLKEQCNQMPVTGEVKNFINRAMGHSKVQLTWQDPELSLPASLKKKNWGKMTDEQLQKVDWGTYLNEEDIQDDENQQELFFQQNQNENVSDWKKQCNKKYRSQNKGQKLVISFDSGFGPSKSEKKQQVESEVPSLKKQKKSKKELWHRAEQERKKRRDELTLMTEHQDQEREKSFKVDLQDDRFGAVYKNPLFSIDPSNPKFDHKRAGNVFKQVVKRNKDKHME